MNELVQKLMHFAKQLTQSGHLKEAVRAIQGALQRSTADESAPLKDPKPAPPLEQSALPSAPHAPLIRDDCLFDAHADVQAATASAPDSVPLSLASLSQPLEVELDIPVPLRHDEMPDDRIASETFTVGIHKRGSQSCRYKLYTPPTSARPLPLVVMLHGCGQDPDDFAAGTGMNERAREQDFYVLYPEQSQAANPQRCWNWFKDEHQKRGSGEPALLASLILKIIAQGNVDPRRVYIAGLSAGGAMAAIMAAAYPEIFAAIGVHSGLPPRAASDTLEALALMKHGRPAERTAQAIRAKKNPAKARHTGGFVPAIVFHGDQDRTVHPRNGEQIIVTVLASKTSRTSELSNGAAAPAKVEQGMATEGHRYTRHIHHDDQGYTMAEHWLVHGSGHAWSGGNNSGSYTDAKGPDATGEILRFFFEQAHFGLQ